MIEIRSNKGGVIHRAETWEELPGIAERVGALWPKYFTNESFPVTAYCEEMPFGVILNDVPKVEGETEEGSDGGTVESL